MPLAQYKQTKSDKTKPVWRIFILGDYDHPYFYGLTFDYFIAHFYVKNPRKIHKESQPKSFIKITFLILKN